MKTFLISLVLSLSLFFVPIKGIMILIGLFIFADTGFGVWASLKLKMPILSRKLSRIAGKMFVYQGGVMLFYGIDVFIFHDFLKIIGLDVEFLLTKLIGISLIGLELFSIDEKLMRVNGIGLLHYFKKIIKSLKFLKKEYDNLK